MKWLAFGIVVIELGGAIFLKLWPAFGSNVTGAQLAKAQASIQYRDGGFVNIVPQSEATAALYWDYLVEQIFGEQ